MSQLDIYDDDEYTHDESEHQMIKERDNSWKKYKKVSAKTMLDRISFISGNNVDHDGAVLFLLAVENKDIPVSKIQILRRSIIQFLRVETGPTFFDYPFEFLLGKLSTALRNEKKERHKDSKKWVYYQALENHHCRMNYSLSSDMFPNAPFLKAHEIDHNVFNGYLWRQVFKYKIPPPGH